MRQAPVDGIIFNVITSRYRRHTAPSVPLKAKKKILSHKFHVCRFSPNLRSTYRVAHKKLPLDIKESIVSRVFFLDHSALRTYCCLLRMTYSGPIVMYEEL